MISLIYQNLPAGRGQKASGTGFGMAIVKAYVEKFGGELSVQSKDEDEFPEDHGTTMTVALHKAS